MEALSKKSDLTFDNSALEGFRANGINNSWKSFSIKDILTVFEKIDALKHFIEQNLNPNPAEALTKIPGQAGKRSFLVFKHHKYIIIPTENIAFFFIKYGASIIKCLDQQEYSVKDSLEHIENAVSYKQFFRLNRQCLINFNVVKEVEPYFSRKLLVKTAIPVLNNFLVSKEKASSFLHWLEDR